jgi:PAS domain-containing protein
LFTTGATLPGGVRRALIVANTVVTLALLATVLGRLRAQQRAVQRAQTLAAQAQSATQRLEDAIEALPAGFELYDGDDRLLLTSGQLRAMDPALAERMRGHPTFEELVRGDECLRHVATLLREAGRRAGDVVTRHGGEEFALRLPHTNAAQAMVYARRCLAGLDAEAIEHGDSPVAPDVTFSIGVATLATGAEYDSARRRARRRCRAVPRQASRAPAGRGRRDGHGCAGSGRPCAGPFAPCRRCDATMSR